MPPDNSCGYCFRRRSGSGTRTPRRSSSARARGSAPSGLDAPSSVHELPLDCEDRIEGGHRLLKDHADLIAASSRMKSWEGVGKVDQSLPCVDVNFSLPPDIRPPPNSTRRMRRGRSPTSGTQFANEADSLTRIDQKTIRRPRRRSSAIRLELDPQTVDRQPAAGCRLAVRERSALTTFDVAPHLVRGSKTSRRMSPDMLSPSTVIATAGGDESRPGATSR